MLLILRRPRRLLLLNSDFGEIVYWGCVPLIFVIILIYAHGADTISFMPYISQLEIFCTFYIDESFMLIYSYKHSVDLGSRLDAFMHRLLELFASDLVIYQVRIFL